MEIDEESKLHELPPTADIEDEHRHKESGDLETFPSLTESKEEILTAVKSAKRLSSGGLQQITPWLLKRAMTASSNEDCAITAALLATRWARGDFPTELCELAAKSKLIALWKDDKKTDVRPISVGCSLRRLLTKAYCYKIKIRIKNLVQKTQLGVLKGGYEVGIHAMRE